MHKTIIKNLEKFRFSTIPLFKVENSIPIIQGTCSLIKYNGLHFLLTAEHVIKGYENNLFLPIEIESEILLRPGGESFLDHVNDIGIILLDQTTVEFINENYIFFEICNNNFDKNIDYEFSFIGFPETKGRFNRYKDRIEIEPFIFTTEKATAEIIKNLNMQNEDKIFIMYDKSKVYNIIEQKYKTGPDLYGISGCALIQHHESEFYIYGILTEWNQQNKNVLIGAKICYIITLLNYVVKKNCS